ncbi:hypothetical protein JCM10207_007820 [Rhodosporidiobolus poonsookiae]
MAEVFRMLYNKLFPPAPLTAPLDGRVYIVTGGLSGIGYFTTLSLAQRGATVLVGVRDLARAQQALSTLEAEHPSLVGRVKTFELDLASFAKAREGAQRALEAVEGEGGRPDGVVNNAARLIDVPFEMGEDGFELSMQTNYLAPILFIETLLPLLEKTSQQPGSDVRLVWVSSNAGSMVPRDWTFTSPASFNQTLAKKNADPEAYYTRFARYGASKMLPTVYIEELQKRLRERGSKVLAIAVNPGGTQTPGTRTMPFPFTLLVPLLFNTTPNGALTSLFALTAPEVRADERKYGGRYLEPYGRVEKVPGPPALAKEETRERVREATREVLKGHGVEL